MDVDVTVDGVELPGYLNVPDDATGIVIFAHGSGSSRNSPRNQQVAAGLEERGLATLLFDLLTPSEGQDRNNVFDIELLAERVVGAIDWTADRDDVGDLRVGLFGASTGAAAALDGAAACGERVRAVVSRGGRPDLASRLDDVVQPVLLIVGGADQQVLELNRSAARRLAEHEVEVVPGAGHLFEGPGELEQVTAAAADWFRTHLSAD
ncbi:MAG: dienelactone hydrolase family protein [Nitriliruptorales bacterium]|nr:dienelactone hydrolase family protein [Nitriliruptorales bacterium]